MGFSVEPPHGGGSHWKLRDRSGKAYTLVCHNGERSEITDVYIRALCRTYGLDYQRFLDQLR